MQVFNAIISSIGAKGGLFVSLYKVGKKNICILLIKIFNRFPIKANKIFFFSYYGSQYGCNPKYITEYILRTYPSGHFELVWAFNDLGSKEHLKGFKKVRTMSLKYFYELCTSKVIITNHRTTELFIKRKDQYYIQTWHSSLRLKKIEKDAETSLKSNYVEMAKKDSLKCDLLLSGCEYSTNIFKSAFWYEGEIFEHGTPRNDILFNLTKEQKRDILKRLDIPENHKVVLYAPTFRRENGFDVYNLEFSNIIESLKNKYGGEWVFLVKLHPHLIKQSGVFSKEQQIIDVTSYDDIQELLGITDFLISDYSSLIFDFAITGRPCFLYVPDFKEYRENDRDLYFNINNLPFITAKSMHELLESINEFNYAKYSESLNDFINYIGTFEDGKASRQLVNHLNQICYGKDGGVTYEAA